MTKPYGRGNQSVRTRRYQVYSKLRITGEMTGEQAGKKRNSRRKLLRLLLWMTVQHCTFTAFKPDWSPVQLRDDLQSEINTEIWTEIQKQRFTKRFTSCETYSQSHARNSQGDLQGDLQRSAKKSCRTKLHIIGGGNSALCMFSVKPDWAPVQPLRWWGLGGGQPGMYVSGSKFFHFHTVFGKTFGK